MKYPPYVMQSMRKPTQLWSSVWVGEGWVGQRKHPPHRVFAVCAQEGGNIQGFFPCSRTVVPKEHTKQLWSPHLNSTADWVRGSQDGILPFWVTWNNSELCIHRYHTHTHDTTHTHMIPHTWCHTHPCCYTWCLHLGLPPSLELAINPWVIVCTKTQRIGNNTYLFTKS